MYHNRARFFLAAVGVIATLTSCGSAGDGSGGPTGPVPNRSAARIQISPGTDTAIVTHTEGDTLHLTVTALDSSGASVALPEPAVWSVIDSAVTVSSTGTVTVLRSGIGRVIATSGKLSDTTTFDLKVTPKLAVRISPRSDTTQNHTIGDTLHLSASVTDVYLNTNLGNAVPVTWMSLDSSATVNSAGDVMVWKSGTARIVATVGIAADTVALALKVTLPRLRLVSINGVSLTPAGPNAVADSFNVSVEVRNPSSGSVINTVALVINPPAGQGIATTKGALGIQPGETRITAVRSLYAPGGSYAAHAQAVVGSLLAASPVVPVMVTNSDVIPPQLLSLSPANDTTWTAGTPLKITLNVVDTQSGVEGFYVHSTWAAAQPAGCIDNPIGSVDPGITFQGIPVTLDFAGCVVPLGANTIQITGIDRAGNTTTRTLTITGI